MTAATYNFNLNQGSKAEFDILLYNSDNTPKIITGNTYTGRIKLDINDIEPWAELEVTVVDGAAGRITVTCPASETAGKLLKGATSHEDVYKALYAIYDTDNEKTLLQGFVYITPQV